MFTIPRFTRSRSRRRPDIGPLLRAEAFAHADHRRLADLTPHVDVLRLRPGETIASAGAAARELVVVLSGEAEAVHADGRRSVLRPGAEIGGAELLARGRHVTSVVAVSDIEVLVVNGPAALWAHAEGTARFGREALGRPERQHGGERVVRREPGGDRVARERRLPTPAGARAYGPVTQVGR